MRRQSTEDLSNRLTEQLAWRKHELINLANMIGSGRGHEQEVLLRAGTVLLYAHWEGFIKAAANTYVEFVESHQPRFEQLNIGLLATALKGRLEELAEADAGTSYFKFIKMMRSDLGRKAGLRIDQIPRTESNLTSVTFKKIVMALGLDYSVYDLQGPAIDEVVSDRHLVAHGDRPVINVITYDQRHKRVLKLLDEFNTQIVNAATMKSYYRGHE